MNEDYKCKQSKSDMQFESTNRNKLKKEDNGILVKLKLKKFMSVISINKTNKLEDKSISKQRELCNQQSFTNNQEPKLLAKIINNKQLNEELKNVSVNDKNDNLPFQELQNILSNRIMEDTIVKDFIEKASNETKIKLAKSNLNLNDPLETHDSIKSFINSANYLIHFLKKNEDNLAKFVEPINGTKKVESKTQMLTRKVKSSTSKTGISLIEKNLDVIEKFKIFINTCSSSFVDEFLNLNGLEKIIELLSCLKYEWRYHPLHFNLIYCIKGVLNSKNGFKTILNHESALNILLQSIYVSDIKIKTKVIELISPLCLWKTGRKKVLGAFDHFKHYARESFRFQYIINLLAFQDGYDEGVKEKLKIAIMSLINLVINGKNTQDDDIFEDLDERLSIRMEFIKLGIQDIINDLLKTNSNSSLERHLDYYEFKRITDENCYLEVSNDLNDFDSSDDPLVTNNRSKLRQNDAKYLFERIDKKINITSMNLNWLSILENLNKMCSTKDIKNLPQLWYTIDRTISRIILDDKSIDSFEKLMSKATENLELLEEIKELNFRLEQTNNEIKSLVQENEAIAREANELRESLNEQIELKKSAHNEMEILRDKMSKDSVNSSTPINSTVKRLSLFRQFDSPVLNETNDSFRSDDIKSSLLTPNTTQSFFQPDSSLNTSNTFMKSSLPIPPPPPPAPPAPPLPFNDILNNNIKKNIPKSECTMKPIHINKISSNNRNETIWNNIDDAKYYQNFDFKKIEEALSIGLDDSNNLTLNYHNKSNSLVHVSNSNPDQTNGDSLYSIQTNPKTIFTDPVRAISTTVARRRFPSSDELVNMIENMDPNNSLGQTEVANLLHLVLTPDEKASLYSCYLPQMDELHNCLYKISKIMYYNEKLEIIEFKSMLKEKMDYGAQLNNVKQCCILLKENKNILKLFEILLCIVNYVNQSNPNGNAVGFKINFLNRLNEIKTNSRGLTLMHYLVMIIKEKYPELLKLPEELDLVKKIAIFNITDISGDITAIDLKMKKINDLMDRIKRDNINFDKNKQFYQAMKMFYDENKKKLESFKLNYNEAINQYTKLSKYFGENGSPSSFNEFFIIWSTFIKSFSATRIQLEQKAQKESRLLSATDSKKNVTPRKRISQEADLPDTLNIEEFDKYCSRIQSGEIYSPSKTLRREMRNRTKSSNLTKGTASRSRSPSTN